MTDKDAMKLALDALEDTHYRIIRAGLLDQDLLNRNFTVATALRERLAQPEQEPVAINWGAVHEKLGLVWYRELSADEGLDEIQDLIHTHQPQRTEQDSQDWKSPPKEDAPLVKWAKEQTTPPQRTSLRENT